MQFKEKSLSDSLPCKLQPVAKIEEKSSEDSYHEKDESKKNQKKSYNVVTYEMRIKLINLSGKKGYSISRAARELGIKPSTGKFIVKSFRDQGRIMKKNIDNETHKQIQAEENKLITISKEDLPMKKKNQKAQQSGNQDSTQKPNLSNEAEHQGNPIMFKNEFNNYFIHIVDPLACWNYNMDGFCMPPMFSYSKCEYQSPPMYNYMQ